LRSPARIDLLAGGNQKMMSALPSESWLPASQIIASASSSPLT
jgi:hypothetical protein